GRWSRRGGAFGLRLFLETLDQRKRAAQAHSAWVWPQRHTFHPDERVLGSEAEKKVDQLRLARIGKREINRLLLEEGVGAPALPTAPRHERGAGRIDSRSAGLVADFTRERSRLLLRRDLTAFLGELVLLLLVKGLALDFLGVG